MKEILDILRKIEDISLEVTVTEADREFQLTQIENLAIKAQKLINDLNRE